ncbi:hypothetical protein EVG20_g4617 [Dentipellis fragilis]|uniref:Uncharacterized protein n=1 Tax=Dentipellis fragilis TaxID=205917 RepID=A0A4Y9YV73_9AGAM|nr:hypothetical protein EVG20_g4617 [Dentipellis fragilis]
MSTATDAGAAYLPQAQLSITQYNERNRAHRGLPTELLREIVLVTFGNYFPDLCINPEFDTSWDAILSFLHASRLLRDIAISILEYVLGDVFIDPQTKALRNYKPVIKELHQLAVVHAREPLETVHDDPAYIAATQHHSDCLLSWQARVCGISISLQHVERSSSPLLYAELSRIINTEIAKLSALHSVPSYITDAIFDSMGCYVLMQVFAHVKSVMLTRLCSVAQHFGPWIHRNSASIVAEIPSDIEAISEEYRVIVAQPQILRKRLLIKFAIDQQRVPKLSEAQIYESGFFDALSIFRCPSSIQDGDVRINFCKQHRKYLLNVIVDEAEFLEPFLSRDPGPPNTSNMPTYIAPGTVNIAEIYSEEEEEEEEEEGHTGQIGAYAHAERRESHRKPIGDERLTALYTWRPEFAAPRPRLGGLRVDRMTWNAAPSLQWHTSHLRKPSYNPQLFKMSAATSVGAACSPQSLGKQHKTHRGLPVEMLREIVLFTFGSYFPEICANPDFNTSWDPILSFMHTSRLLRDVAISILGYTLGDVFIDPQTKVLQNYRPAMKELHQLAVVTASGSLDTMPCIVSWHALRRHITYKMCQRAASTVNLVPHPGAAKATGEIRRIHRLRSIPPYIRREILQPIDRGSLLEIYPYNKGLVLSHMCYATLAFAPWIHRNSAHLVTEIPFAIETISAKFRHLLAQQRMSTNHLLDHVVEPKYIPKLSEAQLRENGLFAGLSMTCCPPAFEDGDVRIHFCKQHRQYLLDMLNEDEVELVKASLKDIQAPDPSMMPAYGDPGTV